MFPIRDNSMSRKWPHSHSQHYHFHIPFPMSIVQKASLHARAKTKTSINQLFTKHKALLLGLKGLPYLLIQIHEIAYIHNELYTSLRQRVTISHFIFSFLWISADFPVISLNEQQLCSASVNILLLLFSTFCNVLMSRKNTP